MVSKHVFNLNQLVMLFLVSLSIVLVACDSFLSDNAFGSRYETNKINKGVWLRHRHGLEGRESSGHFFRSNSNENEPDRPFVNALALRDKRSAPSKSEKRYIKNGNGITKEHDPKTSLFNDFPLGVAMLLENSQNNKIEHNGYSKSPTKTTVDIDSETSEIKQENHSNEDVHFNYLKDILNITEGNTTAKRSMKYDDLVVDRIDLLNVFNKSKDFNKANASGDQIWQTAPVPDKNVYEILPQESTTEAATPKPITEKGLVKVLTMLTRTFKKIMKQHNAIKVIHNEMNNEHKEFREKMEINDKKLQGFDVKYITIMKLVEKLNNFNDCLKNKEEMYKKKEEIMSKNMQDFESQQNKFLVQQQQFYNIQKMMLLQNEKINEKQNSIAKMQNEISHRQNHFVKLLKKEKQNGQSHKYLKLNTGLVGSPIPKKNTTKPDSVITTEATTSIEPIKINLLSIPTNNILEDQDQMMLKEKDDKSVDDLIYKYYFNNTFIDTIIKNKILGGIHIGDKTSIARSAKLAAKRNQRKFARNETKPKTTILFPVDNISFKRQRRWINHHSTRKHRRHHSKGHPLLKDAPLPKQDILITTTPEPLKNVKGSDLTDPFVMMATNFCKEIGQSSTKQILDWCVEKAIRRLSTLDRNLMSVPALPPTPQPKESAKQSTQPVVTTYGTKEPLFFATTPPALFVKDKQKSATKVPGLSGNQFFPDNQELEQNLKAYDLTPDTAGNVYFDGSLHASDILGDKASEGVSDVMPGYDSNSKMELDPRLIQRQLKRKHIQVNIPPKLWKN